MSKHIVDKVAKLLAMAKDENLSEDVAALYAQKAADILAQHNLSMADLSEMEKGGELEEREWQTMYLDPWRRRIIRASAMLYFCDIFIRDWWDEESGRSRAGVVLVGRPHNTYIAREMATYLIDTTMRLAIDYSKVTKSNVRTQRGMRLAFERGCGEKLAYRLNVLRQERMAGDRVRNGTNPGNLPALYDDELAICKAYLMSLGLKPGGFRGSDLQSLHSAAGIRAANTISLSHQIKPGQTTHLLGDSNAENREPEDSSVPKLLPHDAE